MDICHNKDICKKGETARGKDRRCRGQRCCAAGAVRLYCAVRAGERPAAGSDFADGSQIVEPYRPGFDIIFLDIEMPTLGGMPTAERIRLLDPDVVLIFCDEYGAVCHTRL